MTPFAAPIAIVFALLSLTGCLCDESLAAYGASNHKWRLVELDGAPFVATATLSFPKPGHIAGNAPCNGYSGTQSAPYPWFKAERLISTRRACPALQDERRFMMALEAMTLSEVVGDTLVLSNNDGREMVFVVSLDQ